MAVRRCKQCDASVAADEQFCPNCGAFMDPLGPETHGNIISVSSSGFETFQLSEPPDEPKRRPERGSQGPGNSLRRSEKRRRRSEAPGTDRRRQKCQVSSSVDHCGSCATCLPARSSPGSTWSRCAHVEA